MLTDAIQWAEKEKQNKFDQKQMDIMFHARESYLFSFGKPWVKQENPRFDVTMGCYDGAEVCELVGLYILSELTKVPGLDSVGLYRDDGLGVTKGSGPQIEKLRKDIFKVFKKINLQITIEANITQTDFLDLWFDLSSSKFRPFRKDNQIPIYINVDSNHPKTITKQLPNMITDRISKLCSSEETFQNSSVPYQEALHNAGYKDTIKFKKKVPKTSRKRNRQATWFNPPFSKNVRTPIAEKFLLLVDKHFGNSNFKKYFNRKTIKVSYSCMPNMESIIKGQNKKLLNPVIIEPGKKTCSCTGVQRRAGCPLAGHCLTKSIIYNAEVTSGDKPTQDKINYIGLASNDFKERFNNHNSSFRLEHKQTDTELSNFIWKLKREKKPYKIKWNIASRSQKYHPSRKKCGLCLEEKTMILMTDPNKTLNSRKELIAKCRHRAPYLLCNA